MNPDPLGVNAVKESLTETADAFSLMQKTLLVFCGLVAISIVLVSITLIKNSKSNG